MFFGDEGNDNAPLAGYAKVDLHTSYDLTENVQLYGLVYNLFNSHYGLFGNYFNLEAANEASEANPATGDDFFTNPRTITPAPAVHRLRRREGEVLGGRLKRLANPQITILKWRSQRSPRSAGARQSDARGGSARLRDNNGSVLVRGAGIPRFGRSLLGLRRSGPTTASSRSASAPGRPSPTSTCSSSSATT